MKDSEEEEELLTAIERSLDDQGDKSNGVGVKRKGKSKKQLEEASVMEGKWEDRRIDFAWQFADSFKKTVEANTRNGAEGIENLANIIDLVLERCARVLFDRQGKLAQYLIRNPETMRMLLSLAKDGILFKVESWKHVLERCEKDELKEERGDVRPGISSESDLEVEEEDTDADEEDEKQKKVSDYLTLPL